MTAHIDALRRHIAALEAVEAARPGYLAAKKRAQERPTRRNQDAYAKAAAAFAALRSESRSLAVAVPTDGASVTVSPSTIQDRR